MNSELYELILQVNLDKKIFTINATNEIYQIYPLSNKKRIPGTTYINLDDCGKVLREKYKLGKNEELIVFKIEYRNPDYKIPIIEYQIFNENGKKLLNPIYCKDIKIIYFIPKEINNNEIYKYNPEHEYYKDKCIHFKTEHLTDLTLYDRKNEFNNNNMSLCESVCIFKGYMANSIRCECDAKLKFNYFMKNNSDRYSLIHRFEIEETNSNNFWTINCFLGPNSKRLLKFNICSIFLIIIFFLLIFGAVLFRVKEYNIIYKQIKIFIRNFYFLEKQNDDSEKENEDKEINENKTKEIVNEENKENIEDNNIIKEKNIIFSRETEKNKKFYDEIKFAEPNNDILQINVNKINNKKTNQPIRNPTNPRNLSLFSKTSSGFINKNYSKKIILQKQDVMNNLKELTDIEMNSLEYELAKIKDKREFCKYYFSLIRTKHILLRTFKIKIGFDSRIINLCNFLFLLSLHLAINTMFVDYSSIHNIYISKGSFDFIYHGQNIIYATIILYILQAIFSYLINTERNILEIKEEGNKKYFKKIYGIMNIIIIKFILFFTISLLLIFFFWFYISCFATIFPRTQIHLFIRTLISLIFSFILPFALYLLPAFCRIYSLTKMKDSGKELYHFSQFLQLL